MELFKAHYQWAKRPADQRFASLQALYNATKAYAATAREKMVSTRDLVAEAAGGEVIIRRAHSGPADSRVPASLTNWAFKQLCSRVGAPSDYIATLPATLAAQNLNVGLKSYAEQRDQLNLLLHQNGSLLCRSLTTETYERIWNWEIAERLLRLQQFGWEPARPDFNTTGKDFPALYASDHDMFAFIRLPKVYVQQPVAEAHGQAPMYRGAIYENSEVGASSIRVTFFYYNSMCGNHIIWGASNVVELAARHVKNVRGKLQQFELAIRQHAEDSTTDAERRFAKAARTQIAATKDELLDTLFGFRQLPISRTALAKSYDAVLPAQDGDPRTVWGMVQGITRHSQTLQYADQRMQLDKAAGKLLEMVDRF